MSESLSGRILIDYDPTFLTPPDIRNLRCPNRLRRVVEQFYGTWPSHQTMFTNRIVSESATRGRSPAARLHARADERHAA